MNSPFIVRGLIKRVIQLYERDVLLFKDDYTFCLDSFVLKVIKSNGAFKFLEGKVIQI